MQTVRRLWIAALVILTLPGCGSLYLHDAGAKQVTAHARAELDKVNVAAVFDNEAAYLDGLEQEENAAVAASLGAQRDRLLLTMLQGIPGGRDTRAYMGSRIDGYLKGVAGASDRGPGRKLWMMIEDARGRVSAQQPLADALADVWRTDLSQVRAPERVSIPQLMSPSGITLAQAIADSQAAIAQRRKKQEDAAKAQETLKKELQAAADQLSAGTARQETFTTLLATFNQLLQRAKDEANPFIGVLVSESLIAEIDDLIVVSDPKGIDAPADTKTRATIGFVHAAFGVGDAFSSPPRVPHPNALAIARASLAYQASRASTELAQAQSMEAVVHAKLAAVTEQIYYLSRAGEQLATIDTNPAHDDGQGFARLLASNSGATKRGATGTLHYFASAWTKGFIPAQQFNQVAAPLIERRAKLQQSRQAGEAWLGALKPAVATLAAYGEGGIDPHLIAELLQALGLGAIAVGVN